VEEVEKEAKEEEEVEWEAQEEEEEHLLPELVDGVDP